MVKEGQSFDDYLGDYKYDRICDPDNVVNLLEWLIADAYNDNKDLTYEEKMRKIADQPSNRTYELSLGELLETVKGWGEIVNWGYFEANTVSDIEFMDFWIEVESGKLMPLQVYGRQRRSGKKTRIKERLGGDLLIPAVFFKKTTRTGGKRRDVPRERQEMINILRDIFGDRAYLLVDLAGE